MKEEKILRYEDINKKSEPPIVYVIQEIPGTKDGRPKLRKELSKYRIKDYLLLTGDPAIIGVACSIVSDITNGKFNLLKWDKQERKYYSIEIDLYQKDTS